MGKTVNLIAPTKQVRGKRRENHHFLIRLVKYNSYFQVKKKKKEKSKNESFLPPLEEANKALDIPVLNVKSPTTH